MPQKTWVVGEEVLAADFNTFVQDQVVPAFPNTATRDAQWTAPPDGALCVTTDSNQVWQRIAGAWVVQSPGQIVGHFYDPTDVELATGPGQQLLSTNFVALAGHRYQVMADVQLGVASGQGGFTLGLTLDGAVFRSRQGSWGIGGATAGPTVVVSGITGPLTAGAHNVLIASSATATGLFYQDGSMSVIDVGI